MTQSFTEAITGEEKRELLSLCLIAAKQTGFITNDTSDTHDSRLLSLYKEWGGDNFARTFKLIGKLLDKSEASVNFANFCRNKAGEFAKRLESREIKITSLGVEMHVPLGQRGMMVFTVQAEPAPNPDDEELMQAYGLLMTKVIRGYEEYITHAPLLPTKKPYKAQSGDTAKTFEFTSIVEKNEGGKRGYFIKGERFVKYGVRVFPQTLAKAGIDVESITGEKFIAGIATYTSKATGDPDLVIALQMGVTQL